MEEGRPAHLPLAQAPGPRQTFRRFLKIMREPVRAWRAGLALWRGWRFRVLARLRGRRVIVGRNLRIQGRLVLQGPGTVILGDNVSIGMTVTPWTYSPEAVIEIGSNTFLNGTRFGCQRRITIGADGIIGEAQIMDTNFHSTAVNRHDPAAPVKVAPVEIGENVWIGAQVGILPGTSIGRNSVVGFGAVCSGEYPPNMLIAGNPARVIKPVES